MAEPKQRVMGWRSGEILRAVALAMGAFYALRLLWAASPIVLISFLGLLLGLSLGALADRLEKHRIPRTVSAVGVVLIVYGVLVGSAYLFAPLVRSELTSLRTRLPEAIDKVDSQIQDISGFFGSNSGNDSTGGQTSEDTATARGQPSDSAMATNEKGKSGSTLKDQLSREAGALGRFVGPFLGSVASALAGLFIITFIAIYIAIDPKTYREGLLHLVPYRRRERVREVLTETGKVLRQWLLAQFIAMVGVGVITTVGLLLLGIDAAFALGAVAGLLEFVPFIGPIIASVPAIALALTDAPEKALAVAGLYFVVQQIESTLLTPLVMKQSLELPPILTIVAQAVMGVVFGVLGVLVAVPLLAAVMVPVKMLYVNDAIGDPMPLTQEDGD